MLATNDTAKPIRQMTPELKNLYQQTLLRHSKAPYNNQPIDEASNTTLRNPLCGDEITVYRKADSKPAIAFTAQACSICLASASMMTEHLSELNPESAATFAEEFVSNFKSKSPKLELPGDLAALTGVLAFPSRIRCATLPWEAYLKLAD